MTDAEVANVVAENLRLKARNKFLEGVVTSISHLLKSATADPMFGVAPTAQGLVYNLRDVLRPVDGETPDGVIP